MLHINNDIKVNVKEVICKTKPECSFLTFFMTMTMKRIPLKKLNKFPLSCYAVGIILTLNIYLDDPVILLLLQHYLLSTFTSSNPAAVGTFTINFYLV